MNTQTTPEIPVILNRYHLVFTIHGCTIKRKCQVYAATPLDAMTKLNGQKARIGQTVDRIKKMEVDS